MSRPRLIERASFRNNCPANSPRNDYIGASFALGPKILAQKSSNFTLYIVERSRICWKPSEH